MAKFHPTAVQAEPADHLHEIQFKLEGLTANIHQDGVFNLVTKTRPLDLTRVFSDLVEQGIDDNMAGQACDAMSEFIFGRQLGEYFAKNMKRVG